MNAQDAYRVAKAADLDALHAERLRSARKKVEEAIARAATNGKFETWIWHPRKANQKVIGDLQAALQAEGFNVRVDTVSLLISWRNAGDEAEVREVFDFKPAKRPTSEAPPARIFADDECPDCVRMDPDPCPEHEATLDEASADDCPECGGPAEFCGLDQQAGRGGVR